MPPKKRVDLPDHVRAAVLGDVAHSCDVWTRAEEDFKIRTYYAVEQGVTQREIADQLGVTQQVVSKYASQGREFLAERERVRVEQAGAGRDREDPDRSGKLITHGF